VSDVELPAGAAMFLVGSFSLFKFGVLLYASAMVSCWVVYVFPCLNAITLNFKAASPFCVIAFSISGRMVSYCGALRRLNLFVPMLMGMAIFFALFSSCMVR